MTNFIQPISKGRTAPFFSENDKDCSVRAYANAMVVDYSTAYNVLKNAGRIHGNGMNMSKLHECYTDNGLLLKGLFGSNHDTRFMVDYLDKKGSSYCHYKGITLENALNFLNEGNYIFITNDHCLAVIDGEVIDTFPSKAGTRIVAVYEVI